MGSFTTKVATLPGQTKHHDQNKRTANQDNGRESEDNRPEDNRSRK